MRELNYTVCIVYPLPGLACNIFYYMILLLLLLVREGKGWKSLTAPWSLTK